MLYDALAPHVTLVIVVDSNRKDHRKPDFVGEVSPFLPLCIDEGSFCSMPNHERGTVGVIRQAPRATDGQALLEQFKHLQVGGCAISVGTRPPEWRGNHRSYAVYFAVQVLRRVTAADDESAETG